MVARNGRPSGPHGGQRCPVLGLLLMVLLTAILALAGVLLGLVPAATASTPPPTSTSDSNYDSRVNVAHTLASDGLRPDVAVPGRGQSGLVPEAAFGRASGFAVAAETATKADTIVLGHYPEYVDVAMKRPRFDAASF